MHPPPSPQPSLPWMCDDVELWFRVVFIPLSDSLVACGPEKTTFSPRLCHYLSLQSNALRFWKPEERSWLAVLGEKA